MDPLQWMGAVSMRVKNITINPQVIHISWSEHLHVSNKFIKTFFSSEKGILSDSGEKYTLIKHRLQAKTV